MISPNRLACETCRKRWWQCRDRIRYSILHALGETLFQCTYHEDIDAFKRKEEARRMLKWINEQKERLKKILEEKE